MGNVSIFMKSFLQQVSASMDLVVKTQQICPTVSSLVKTSASNTPSSAATPQLTSSMSNSFQHQTAHKIWNKSFSSTHPMEPLTSSTFRRIKHRIKAQSSRMKHSLKVVLLCRMIRIRGDLFSFSWIR